MADYLQEELRIALDAAHRAGAMILEEYGRFEVIPNAPATISTHVDHQSQEIILQTLQQAFPQDALCAEEATITLAEARTVAERIWVVDPIDGTRGFARKNGQFSVMIGLRVGPDVILGVVHEPVFNRTTYAVKGRGCFVLQHGESQRCHVSPLENPTEGRLTQSHTKPGKGPSPAFSRLERSAHQLVETYSAGVKMALIARGEAEWYVNTEIGFKDWDIAAGHILVTEAGGHVTTLAGSPIRYGEPGFVQRSGMIASNGHLHALAVQQMKDFPTPE
ncbi:3'(2'),5'-bisphosphate nucleotidase CysQ family protein [Tuwongella immobilis]|uniref:3'(2'),5'-bisphosphate nucleotidase n=1 Tax=Tuwongella immobilis TaxID=692036 RepID=A0A6C2YMS9_9BACT